MSILSSRLGTLLSELKRRHVFQVAAGYAAVAFVVLQADAKADPEELLDWAAERLTKAKRPREVHLVDELPRTSVGKIRKFLLPGGQP